MHHENAGGLKQQRQLSTTSAKDTGGICVEKQHGTLFEGCHVQLSCLEQHAAWKHWRPGGTDVPAVVLSLPKTWVASVQTEGCAKARDMASLSTSVCVHWSFQTLHMSIVHSKVT